MNSVHTSQKLEQLRREATTQHELAEIRRQHINTLVNAARTLLLEIRALTIGSLELVVKPQVQNHV